MLKRNKKTKFLVAIYLKSGAIIRGWFYDFSVTKVNGLQSISWEPAEKNKKYLYISVDDISAIVQERVE